MMKIGPTRSAWLLCLGYVVVAGTYIVVSGSIAKNDAASVDELARHERIKGLAYVGVTAALLFVGSSVLFRRLQAQADDIARHRDALLEADRRAIAGLLASAVAHDVKNLLHVVLGNAEMLEAHVERTPEARRLFADLEGAAGRMLELAARLRDATKLDDPPREVDLTRLIHDDLGVLNGHERIRNVRLSVRAPDALRVFAQPSVVRRALMNLVLNAAEAAGPGGRVEVRVVPREGRVVIEVHDSGPGVPRELRRSIFEPGYSTKLNGTGLGLLSVTACATQLAADVDLGESDLGGACFSMRFPKAASASRQPALDAIRSA